MAFGVALHVLFRFLHIASVILLIGGIGYARQVATPVFNMLPDDLLRSAARDAQGRYRTTLFVLLALIIGSGLYNFFTAPKHGQTYQIWFGIKILLVAHIVTSAILWATSPFGDVAVEGKGKHRLSSIAISGLIVVLISAYLRSLTQRGL